MFWSDTKRLLHMENKVAIIIPYFGRFPEWFDLYLYSCSKNPFIDFLFYTDCELPARVYENTKFKRITFEDYCNCVSHALNIDFCPKSAYKLCDCKPFYGLIHKEDIQNYEYWGFGDCDLVYGDLSIFINEEVLRRYDFITTHGYCVAGHFTIMRNKSKYTSRCLDIPQWQLMLSKPEHCNLDENAYSFAVRPSFKYIHRVCRYIIRPLKIINDSRYYKFVNSLLCNRFSKYLFKEFNTSPAPKPKEQWIYDKCDGKVINCQTGQEIPYLHFLFFKKTPYLNAQFFWKEGFYQLSELHGACDQSISKIHISLEGIKNEIGEYKK